ncbi:unnamed protein product [Brassica oleracea var. botrytis]
MRCYPLQRVHRVFTFFTLGLPMGFAGVESSTTSHSIHRT